MVFDAHNQVELPFVLLASYHGYGPAHNTSGYKPLASCPWRETAILARFSEAFIAANDVEAVKDAKAPCNASRFCFEAKIDQQRVEEQVIDHQD